MADKKGLTPRLPARVSSVTIVERMNPVFNTSGYVLEKGELRLLQKEGWVSVQLADIAEVKKPTFASAIVRLADGRRKSLDLSHLSTAAFSEVSAAFDTAVRTHRAVAARKEPILESSVERSRHRTLDEQARKK